VRVVDVLQPAADKEGMRLARICRRKFGQGRPTTSIWNFGLMSWKLACRIWAMVWRVVLPVL